MGTGIRLLALEEVHRLVLIIDTCRKVMIQFTRRNQRNDEGGVRPESDMGEGEERAARG